MTQSVVLFAVTATLTASMSGNAQNLNPQIEGMKRQGCVRAERANPDDPGDKSIVFVLETIAEGSTEHGGATVAEGKAPSAQQSKDRILLSSTETAKSLATYVGRQVEVTGELLMPPGVAPAARGQTTPLPGDAEGTFRVTVVRVLAAKCS